MSEQRETKDPADVLASVLAYADGDPPVDEGGGDEPPELTVAEQEALVVAAGGSPDAIRAAGVAHADKLLGPPIHPPAQAVPAQPADAAGSAGAWGWVLGVIVVAGALVAALLSSEKPKDTPLPPEVVRADAGVPSDAPMADAPDESVQRRESRRLIATATAKCAKKQWDACLRDLDEARSLDPSSVTPAVDAMREAATKALPKERDLKGPPP